MAIPEVHVYIPNGSHVFVAMAQAARFWKGLLVALAYVHHPFSLAVFHVLVLEVLSL